MCASCGAGSGEAVEMLARGSVKRGLGRGRRLRSRPRGARPPLLLRQDQQVRGTTSPVRLACCCCSVIQKQTVMTKGLTREGWHLEGERKKKINVF